MPPKTDQTDSSASSNQLPVPLPAPPVFSATRDQNTPPSPQAPGAPSQAAPASQKSESPPQQARAPGVGAAGLTWSGSRERGSREDARPDADADRARPRRGAPIFAVEAGDPDEYPPSSATGPRSWSDVLRDAQEEMSRAYSPTPAVDMPRNAEPERGPNEASDEREGRGGWSAVGAYRGAVEWAEGLEGGVWDTDAGESLASVIRCVWVDWEVGGGAVLSVPPGTWGGRARGWPHLLDVADWIGAPETGMSSCCVRCLSPLFCYRHHYTVSVVCKLPSSQALLLFPVVTHLIDFLRYRYCNTFNTSFPAVSLQPVFSYPLLPSPP